MDISVKKLSEILKIDPNALLEKMIAAGLPQKILKILYLPKINKHYCLTLEVLKILPSKKRK